jgi:hypothetical protein
MSEADGVPLLQAAAAIAMPMLMLRTIPLRRFFIGLVLQIPGRPDMLQDSETHLQAELQLPR